MLHLIEGPELRTHYRKDRIDKRRKKPTTQQDSNPWPLEFCSAGECSTAMLQPLPHDCPCFWVSHTLCLRRNFQSQLTWSIRSSILNGRMTSVRNWKRHKIKKDENLADGMAQKRIYRDFKFLSAVLRGTKREVLRISKEHILGDNQKFGVKLI